MTYLIVGNVNRLPTHQTYFTSFSLDHRDVIRNSLPSHLLKHYNFIITLEFRFGTPQAIRIVDWLNLIVLISK